MAEKHQYFDGKMFTRDEETGYYLCSSKSVDGSRKRLHVYVWEYYNGPVPIGYHIHHKDEDKNNNDISNLELKLGVEHLSLHAKENFYRNHDKALQHLEKIRPMTKEWHKGDEGRKWHKDHYEEMKDKLHVDEEYVCVYCKKRFVGRMNGQTKFCSNNCKSRYRNMQGVDNIEAECIVCGKKFIKNKYSKTQTCSRECGTKLLVYRRNKIHW